MSACLACPRRILPTAPPLICWWPGPAGGHMDDDRRELAGGWVAITDGLVSGVGAAGIGTGRRPMLHADGCLVTPGPGQHPPPHLPEPHPRLPAGHRSNLFGWLTTLYPIWAGLDEEAAYLSAWVGLAELALGGCTTIDGPPLRPPARRAATSSPPRSPPRRELGMRFHATRGSMSRSEKDGGLPPDSVVQDDDTILAESERLVGTAPRSRPAGHGRRWRWPRARRSRSPRS